MKLRLRSPQGQSTFGDTLTAESTILDLKQLIASTSGIQVTSQSIKFGFPPKPLLATDQQTLQEAGIKNGEQIVVEQVATSAALGPPTTTRSPTTQPLASPSSRTVVPSTNGKEQVQTREGVMVLREMKDDNSCLFRSIGYVAEKSYENIPRLRSIVAEAIRSDPFNFNEAILGRDPDDYCRWILEKNSWGGAIELAIFSDYFQLEIDSIDVKSLRVDKFGQGKYSKRVFIIYNGIHYDAIALSPISDAPMDFDQTTFDVVQGQDELLEAAVALVSILKQKKKFTDLANFTLTCGICRKNLVGQKDAQEHAMATGHQQFTEYSSD